VYRGIGAAILVGGYFAKNVGANRGICTPLPSCLNACLNANRGICTPLPSCLNAWVSWVLSAQIVWYVASSHILETNERQHREAQEHLDRVSASTVGAGVLD
jgi:hypothetical protein